MRRPLSRFFDRFLGLVARKDRKSLLEETLAAPPSAQAPSPDAPAGPALVAAGSFRVDRGRALQKLMAHQLENPTAFLLCWIRCAVASGATWIRMDRTGSGVRVRFDGRPLPADAVRDPYENLFSGSERDPARHLAVGLLGAMRLGPSAVRLVSGPPEARVRYEVGLEGEGFPEKEGGEAVTELSIAWESQGYNDPGPENCLETARDGFGMASVALIVMGKPVPSIPEGWKEVLGKFKGRARGGRWRLARGWRSLGKWRGRVFLYHLGALVGPVPWTGNRAVEALVSDDEARLNLSHSGAVRDARLEETLDALTREVAAMPVPAPRRGAGRRPLARPLVYLGILAWAVAIAGGWIAIAGWGAETATPGADAVQFCDMNHSFAPIGLVFFVLFPGLGALALALLAARRGAAASHIFIALTAFGLLWLIPMMGVSYTHYNALAVAGGRVELIYAFPSVRKVPAADIERVDVVRNDVTGEDGRETNLMLAIIAKDGKKFESCRADPGAVLGAVRRLEGKLPIRYWREENGSFRTAATREQMP